MAGNHRFGRQHRLGSASIANLLARGRRVRAAEWSLSITSNEMGIARLGLIIPKRQLSRAVDRNTVKRRIREWFRLSQADFAGKDLLVRLTSVPKADETIQRLESLAKRLK